jgi:hypothetical protein
MPKVEPLPEKEAFKAKTPIVSIKPKEVITTKPLPKVDLT